MLTALQYLKIDIAGNFDGAVDKMDWLDRVAYFDNLVAAKDHDYIVEHAENPALTYAGLQAYRAALRGDPSGYPISLDACSSGLQILSVMVNCEKSAKLCGVVSTGHREDAYTIIYQDMMTALDKACKITRADCKRAIMTALYSSTAVPKQVFGEGEQLAAFYASMEKLAPGAWELNKALLGLWQPYADSHDWVMPDNFNVHVKVEDHERHHVQFLNVPIPVDITVNKGTKEGRSLPANITHSVDGMIVREMDRRCNFNVDRMLVIIPLLGTECGKRMETEDDLMVAKLWEHYTHSKFLSARILDHLNPHNMGLVDHKKIATLVKCMPEKRFELIAIHDCFRCLPNYGNDLRRQYNQIMAEIAASDMLYFLASQVVGYQLPVKKLGNIALQCLDADYMLS
jgi:hypothetical protein